MTQIFSLKGSDKRGLGFSVVGGIDSPKVIITTLIINNIDSTSLWSSSLLKLWTKIVFQNVEKLGNIMAIAGLNGNLCEDNLSSGTSRWLWGIERRCFFFFNQYFYCFYSVLMFVLLLLFCCWLLGHWKKVFLESKNNKFPFFNVFIQCWYLCCVVIVVLLLVLGHWKKVFDQRSNHMKKIRRKRGAYFFGHKPMIALVHLRWPAEIGRI